MFFGGKDDRVLNQPPSHYSNPACAGLDLSKSTLDVKGFKSLLDCLNAEKALQPIAELIHSLRDYEIEPIVNVLNKHLLSNYKLMYQLEQTYFTLDRLKIVDVTFQQVGKLLENEEFVSASIALLREASRRTPDSPMPDPDLLTSIEIIAGKIQRENITELMDFLLSTARARSFASLQSHFTVASPSGRSLEEITEPLHRYFSSVQGDPGHEGLGREMLVELANGDLFAALDDFLGVSAESIRLNSTQVSATLELMTRRDERVVAPSKIVLDDMTSLFHRMVAPIPCFDGARQVANPAMFVMGELARLSQPEAAPFLAKVNPVQLAAMNPFCVYPPAIDRYYPAMAMMAEQHAVRPMQGFLKSMYKVERAGADGKLRRPLAEWFVRLLSDTGVGPNDDQAGAKLMTPLLSELSDRGAWDDLFLVINLLPVEKRDRLMDLARFLIEPRSELRGRTIYDVMTGVVSRTSFRNFNRFVRSLERFVDSDAPLLNPALTALRTAMHVNDVNPVFDVTREILSGASNQSALFETLFRIAEQPKFGESVRFISELAQNGRLKILVNALVTLYHPFASKGQSPVHETPEPAFEPMQRHDWYKGDLAAFPNGPEGAKIDPACARVKMLFPMAEPGKPGYEEQLQNMLKCLNSAGDQVHAVNAVEFLRRARTEQGQDYFSFQISLMKSMGLSGPQMGWMIDRAMEAYDDGSLDKLIRSFPLFASRAVHSPNEAAWSSGPVLQPLLQALGPWMTVPDVRSSLRQLSVFGSQILPRDSVPRAMRYIDRLLDQTAPSRLLAEAAPLVTAPAVSTYDAYDTQHLVRWLKARECELHPKGWSEAQWIARANEVKREAHDAKNGWEVIGGKARTSWTMPEFVKWVDPILATFADPESAQQARPILKATLNFLKYFTLTPGAAPAEGKHYRPDALRDFFVRRSTDIQPVSMYYKNEKGEFEKEPRVRLMSTLDRLDAILMNVDFTAPWPVSKNLGLEFLALMGDAWGDEPYEVWPAEIKEKYKNKKPMTLRQAVLDILDRESPMENLTALKNILGFPFQANCPRFPDVPRIEEGLTGGLPSWMTDLVVMRPYLYNIEQVKSVLLENLPDSIHTNRGGLRVLRDLFFEINYSTPAKHRNAKAGDKNHLKLVMNLVRVGLTRIASSRLIDSDPNDPVIRDFFRALIISANEPWAESLGKSVLANDKSHKLFRGLLTELFNKIDQSSPEEIATMRKMGLYSMAFMGSNVGNQPVDLLPGFIRNLAVAMPRYYQFLANHTDLVGDLATNEKSARLIKALYESDDQESKIDVVMLGREALSDTRRLGFALRLFEAIDDDANAKQAWDLAWDRLDVLKTTPEYQALDFEVWKDRIWDFASENIQDPAGVSAARRSRYWMAEQLGQGTTDQFLLLTSHPSLRTEFYNRVVQAVSTASERGQLQDFIGMARRALSGPAR